MTTPTELDLVSLRAPAPIVTLPSGARVQLEYMRGPAFTILWRWQDDPADVGLMVELLQLILPGATIRDIESLAPTEAVQLIGLAQAKILLVEQARKNGESDADAPAASPTQP